MILKFGDKNPDVWKSVVFFLVECMIKLGKEMDRYLEGLMKS